MKFIREEYDRVRRIPDYATRRRPHVIPTSGIFDSPTYCIRINAEWLSHVIGALESLDQPDAWLGLPDEIFAARQQILLLITEWIKGDCEAQMKPCMPIGTVFTSIRDEVEGCLLCDGASYFADDYPELFAVLPDRYKFDSLFSVPDMRGRVPVGNTPANGDIPALGTGDNGGAWKHQLSLAEMPVHAHTVTSLQLINTNIQTGTNFVVPFNTNSPAHPTTDAQGGGQKHNNAQPYLALNYFIVAQPDCGDSQMAEQLRFRQNPDNSCLLQYSINQGANWLTAFDYSQCAPAQLNEILSNQAEAERLLRQLLELYDGTPESIAPNALNDDAFRDAAMCYALRVLVDTTLDVLADEKENFRKKAIIFGNAIAALSIVAFWPGTLALIFAGGITAGIQFITEANLIPLTDTVLRDEDARKEIVCCAMNRLRGNTPTQVLFQSIFFMCLGVSDNAQKQGAAMHDVTQNLDVYLAFLSAVEEGYNLAERGLIADDCNCFAPCPYFAGVWVNIGATPSEWRGERWNGYGGAYIGTLNRAANQNWNYVADWQELQVIYTLDGTCAYNNAEFTAQKLTSNSGYMTIRAVTPTGNLNLANISWDDTSPTGDFSISAEIPDSATEIWFVIYTRQARIKVTELGYI